MPEAHAINWEMPQPVTHLGLVRDLHLLGVRPGMTLLVHSALSRLGWVCGGAQAVVQALQDVLGPTGTLVMPTFSTDLTDPAHWQRPPVPKAWWDVIRETMPVFDPALTPTRQMGAIVDCFRSQPGVMRSYHPHVSFAARGPHADQIIGQHSLAHGLGEDSPLARIYELNGYVLLLGVGHNNNTSLHLAEYRAEYDGKRATTAHAPMLVNGEREWVSFSDIDWDDSDFSQLGVAFRRSTSCERAGAVGNGRALLMPQRPLVDFAVEWMTEHRRI